MHKLIWKKRAARGLAAVPTKAYDGILAAIEGLQVDPRPRGAEKLRGRLQGLYRIRVGQYRVLYEVDDEQGAVTIHNVGSRQGIY